MTEPTEVKEPGPPPHHWNDKVTGQRYAWGGGSTCFCTTCRRLFSSPSSFQGHLRTTTHGDDSFAVCQDPAEMRRQDEEPAFEKLDKPGWNPPELWRKTSAVTSDSVPPWKKR